MPPRFGIRREAGPALSPVSRGAKWSGGSFASTGQQASEKGSMGGGVRAKRLPPLVIGPSSQGSDDPGGAREPPHVEGSSGDSLCHLLASKPGPGAGLGAEPHFAPGAVFPSRCPEGMARIRPGRPCFVAIRIWPPGAAPKASRPRPRILRRWQRRWKPRPAGMRYLTEPCLPGTDEQGISWLPAAVGRRSPNWSAGEMRMPSRKPRFSGSAMVVRALWPGRQRSHFRVAKFRAT